jgi:hypothetical protein
MLQELAARLPYYVDDWTVSFKSKKNLQRTIASTFFIFITSIGPAVTFASFLTKHTDGQYSTIDVLLSSAINGMIFSIFSGQPLVIVGVTGPVSIFLETLFALNRQFNGGIPYLPMVFWIGFWAAVIHIVLALTGACRLVELVTPFTCEVFAAFIGLIYIYTAGRQIVEAFDMSSDVKMSDEVNMSTGLLVLILAVATFALCRWASRARLWVVFNKGFRGIVADYAVPVSVVLVTGLYQIPFLNQVRIDLLPTALVFGPSNGRMTWWVNPMDLSAPLIFAAFIPAFILTILIFFDHNVSALLAVKQKGVKLQKPSTYNWDFLVVGLSMLLTGSLGLPFTHGLIPQAPLHVRSLAKEPNFKKSDNSKDGTTDNQTLYSMEFNVLEQRVSNFAQSLLTLLVCTIGGLLFLLSKIPVAVLNGLFLFMGAESFINNAFASRLFMLIFVPDRQTREQSSLWPSRLNSMSPSTSSSSSRKGSEVPLKKIAFFVFAQLAMLGLIFGITVSSAAIFFPIAIILTVVVRFMFGARWMKGFRFSLDELAVLDGDAIHGDVPVIENSEEVLLDVLDVVANADDRRHQEVGTLCVERLDHT